MSSVIAGFKSKVQVKWFISSVSRFKFRFMTRFKTKVQIYGSQYKEKHNNESGIRNETKALYKKSRISVPYSNSKHKHKSS